MSLVRNSTYQVSSDLYVILPHPDFQSRQLKIFTNAKNQAIFSNSDMNCIYRACKAKLNEPGSPFATD